MRKTILFACLVAPLLPAQVPNQEHHQHMHAETYAKVLEDPSRDAWQKPHEVLMALDLKKSEAVADIGAGTGYFSRRFARHAGAVWAVDIDPKLLEIAGKNKPANLQLVHAKMDDPSLPAASVDTIFICDVWHHIDGRPAYLAKLKNALRPGGRIVIIDFKEGKLPVGPPPSMKIPEAGMIGEFAAAGFRLSRRHDILPHQYFLEFRQP
jgi:arsenite methyltransferase